MKKSLILRIPRILKGKKMNNGSFYKDSGYPNYAAKRRAKQKRGGGGDDFGVVIFMIVLIIIATVIFG